MITHQLQFMGISNRLRPALGRITSSVASTANYGITRVLSFTDSFNEQTSLLLDSALAHDHEQEGVVDDAPGQITPTIIGALDVEAAAPPSTIGQQGQEPAAAAAPSTPDAETKRVAKVVQTVCLFGASASLLVFINDPPRGGSVMYRANLGFVCLGLSMFSIVARSGEAAAAVARVQRWGMVVVVASTLRMVTMLPAASLESAFVLAAFVLAGLVAVVYLPSLAWKLGAADDAIQAEASSAVCDNEAGVAADQV